MRISYNSYYENLSKTSESEADRLYWMLNAVRGVKYHPRIFQLKPKWYERWKRIAEKTFIQVVSDALGPITSDFSFSEEQRSAYWTEISRGQYPSEDAGGYSVRCLNGLLTGELTMQGETYDEMYRRLIRET